LACAPPAEGADTYLVERDVHTGHRVPKAEHKHKHRGCGKGTGRVVDRLAERRWDTFDPVIQAAPSEDVNALPPCDWVHGGAASRDIARHPVFLKMRGYAYDGRMWRRPHDHARPTDHTSH
jgi:hypothetical protein